MCSCLIIHAQGRGKYLKLCSTEMTTQGGCEPHQSQFHVLISRVFVYPWDELRKGWVEDKKGKDTGPFRSPQDLTKSSQQKNWERMIFLGLGRKSRYGKHEKINCPLMSLEASLNLSIIKPQTYLVVRHADGTKSNLLDSGLSTIWF